MLKKEKDCKANIGTKKEIFKTNIILNYKYIIKNNNGYSLIKFKVWLNKKPFSLLGQLFVKDVHLSKNLVYVCILSCINHIQLLSEIGYLEILFFYLSLIHSQLLNLAIFLLYLFPKSNIIDRLSFHFFIYNSAKVFLLLHDEPCKLFFVSAKLVLKAITDVLQVGF